MAYQTRDRLKIWGIPDEEAIAQAVTCANTGNAVEALLMADHCKGYSQPTGAVVIYEGQISPTGVGCDIACGNKAVRTGFLAKDIRGELPAIMDEIARQISFGAGRVNNTKVDHSLFDDPRWDIYKDIGRREYNLLKELAITELGTVGSGNHFVSLLEETATGELWIANHFGSRSLGYKTACGFINLAVGRKFLSSTQGKTLDQPPILLDAAGELGQMYSKALQLVGLYASAGRDYVIEQVLRILGTTANFEVHNHHNFASEEVHNGKTCVVVRKGVTLSVPGQLSLIGGSMIGTSVIVQGKDTQENKDAYYSCVHGSGRIRNSMQGISQIKWNTRVRSGSQISVERADIASLRDSGAELRSTAAQEDSLVYQELKVLLEAHKETLEILHVLKPIGVCAAADDFDPYKD